MRKTLFRLSMIAFTLLSMQNTLTAQEKTPLNQVVNTLKERISLAGYAQLGYTYDDAANPDNTFDTNNRISQTYSGYKNLIDTTFTKTNSTTIK